jgi:hypothetical protein
MFLIPKSMDEILTHHVFGGVGVDIMVASK